MRGLGAPPIPAALRHVGLSYPYTLDLPEIEHIRRPPPQPFPVWTRAFEEVLDQLPKPGGHEPRTWLTRGQIHTALSFDPRRCQPEWAVAASPELLVQLGNAQTYILGLRPPDGHAVRAAAYALSWWLRRPGVLVWAYALETRPPAGRHSADHQAALRAAHHLNAHAPASVLATAGLVPGEELDVLTVQISETAPPLWRSKDRKLPLFVPYFLPPSTRPYPRYRAGYGPHQE